MQGSLKFNDVTIQKLFGHEAAEDEDPKRLESYYYKTETYQQVTSDLPVRVLVGHKGIGKSAMFKVAMSEDAARGKLAVMLKPDDIIELELEESDFLKAIRAWKKGLREILRKKVLESLGISSEGIAGSMQNAAGGLLSFLEQTFRNLKPINYEPTKEFFVRKYLESNEVNVYIDDLDRGWQGRKSDVRRISALLNAIRDISNEERGVRFKIGLRSDVYYLVRTSDESTDKIEGSVVWHAWTNHEILVLLVKRVETFFGRDVNETALMRLEQKELARLLSGVMESTFTGSGLWERAPMYRVLMSLIRKRPRDLVKLCTLAARAAERRRSSVIQTVDFRQIFEEYSQGRVQDTINEYRSELPNIEALLTNMKPNRKERFTRLGYTYTTADLLEKLSNICKRHNFTFANGEAAQPKQLAAFLYKINFLTARKQFVDGLERRYFEENRYLSNEFSDFGFDWEIHPAYRWALQASNLDEIFQSLELSR